MELHLVWLIVVILYLVWFMVVMVILPSSSKQTWPALGGSTEEQSKNLTTNTVILRYSRFTLWTHKEADQKPNHTSGNFTNGLHNQVLLL